MNRTISVVPEQINLTENILHTKNREDNTQEAKEEDHLNHEEDNFHPNSQKSSIPHLISPQTHVAQILDTWEGSSFAKDTKEKELDLYFM